MHVRGLLFQVPSPTKGSFAPPGRVAYSCLTVLYLQTGSKGVQLEV